MEMRWHLGILPRWLQKQAGFPGEDVVVVDSFHRREEMVQIHVDITLDLSSKESRSFIQLWVTSNSLVQS